MKILECVPNFSEGRDEAKVEEIVEQIRKASGVNLLDYSRDEDHNRSVVTFVGDPDKVVEAALRASLKAIELIDMQRHSGSHPRLGAADVVPFVPIQDVEMEEAVEAAHRFGRELGKRAAVPVYFYEEAATKPERQSLPAIRKGEYEELAEKMKDPQWFPDAGPNKFNPKAGATIVGARHALIAFNVNINTQDLEIAKKIARAVRFIDGGFHYVRAMGVSLAEKGICQISMNLLNYHKSPIHRVFETIRSEASRYGLEIVESEIVGLIPVDALAEVARFYLRAHDFTPSQVIENRLL